ncbi:glycosyl hydrolase family 71-domain-containing protein [Favolaschia claudopus]|uniref:Glycosyl hydrolase family 71-domain-containing protein n=1 Tax=Favolaschia claudopus TaxID=2862362 RepID=A0AAW0CHM5_9AGAR
MLWRATLAFTLSALQLVRALNPAPRANSPKAVYAHFMVGIVENFSVADWVTEIRTAKAIGIDGFALNCAPPRVDSYTPKQLANAYAAATQVGGFTMFPSFDFAYWNNGDTNTILEVLSNYSSLPSQALTTADPLSATFVGEFFDWNTVKSQFNVFAIPNLEDPAQVSQLNTGFDGAFSWYAWPTFGGNSIKSGPMTTEWDDKFVANLKNAGKGQIYMMPVSPWFSTHFGSKNWVFIAEQLITDRWPQVLSIQPELVEIVTWNDFGESHYISDSEPNHSDDGSSVWANGYPHAGWRIIMQAYIAAYKAGASAPSVTGDQVVYWYRGFPKNTRCTNDTLGPPNGIDLLQDLVFVTTLVASPAQLTVTVPAGVTTHNFTMGIGSQVFSLSRNGAQVGAGQGGLQIKDSCTIYNYNAYVGNFGAGGVVTPPSSSQSATSSRPQSSSSSSASSPLSPPRRSTTGCAGCTVTASSQIAPTNCLQPGCVWRGPAGQSTPDHCDTGGKPPVCTGS